MTTFFKKHRLVIRVLAFCLLLGTILRLLSLFSIRLGQDRNPKKNYASTSLFTEPDFSIDVLTIGTSNVYCGVNPLQWWQSSGIASYTWGEPSQRLFDTYQYLKQIYRHQSPKVVFLEADPLFRDATWLQAADSYAKAQIARLFPIVTYHRFLSPDRFDNFCGDGSSLTHGYCLRTGTQEPSSKKTYLKPDSDAAPVFDICRQAMEQCINYCREQGSEVVLLSVCDRGWRTDRHNAVAELAEEWGVPYLDLNIDLAKTIDWRQDTADGGTHLNYRGAEKVTAYLEAYLQEHYDLPDHRSDPAYADWNQDAAVFQQMLQQLTQPAAA